MITTSPPLARRYVISQYQFQGNQKSCVIEGHHVAWWIGFYTPISLQRRDVLRLISSSVPSRLLRK